MKKKILFKNLSAVFFAFFLNNISDLENGDGTYVLTGPFLPPPPRSGGAALPVGGGHGELGAGDLPGGPPGVQVQDSIFNPFLPTVAFS